MNLTRLSILGLTILASSNLAFALAADYPPSGGVPHPASWPPNLLAAVSAPSRVGGYYVNSDDYLAFKGDSAAFQNFLDTCMALSDFGRLTLMVHQGKGAFQPRTKTVAVSCDWQLDIIDQQARLNELHVDGPAHHLDLHVWLGGAVDLQKIKLPDGLKVWKE